MGTGVPIFMGSPFLRDTGVKEIWGPPVLGTPGPHISLKIGTRGPYFYGRFRDPIVNIPPFVWSGFFVPIAIA